MKVSSLDHILGSVEDLTNIDHPFLLLGSQAILAHLDPDYFPELLDCEVLFVSQEVDVAVLSEDDDLQKRVAGLIDAMLGELAFERGSERVEATLRSADRLVVLGSDDSLYHVDVARRMALGEGLAPGEVRPIFALDPSAIQTALAGQRPGEEAWARGMVARGQVRRYFDHQFAVNSLAILGKTLDETAFISKYQLQTLYLLAHLGPLTEGETHQAMAQWAGTGRYAMDGEMDGLGLGTAMSRATILEQMVSRGWVDQHPREGRPGRGLSVSVRGRQVLERLHPGCEDPDLPFRLHLWAERGLGESQGAIDRYIRTFFGRQKRFWEAERRK